MSCSRPNVARSNPYDLGQLNPVLRDRLWTAILDCPYKLSLVSGLRDSGRQWDLRHERCPGRECNWACKGYPVTALPGNSDHQNGLAADMGGAGLSWLIANRERYGLALTVSSENWHFSAKRRDVKTGRIHDDPTVRIVAYGKAIDDPKPPVIVKKPPPALKKGSKGVAVTVLKKSLNDVNRVYLGRPALKATSVFDSDTEAMLIAFKRFYNGMAALAGLKTKLALTGELNEKTSGALQTWATLARKRMAEETMRPKDSGLDVLWLQHALNLWSAAYGKKGKIRETSHFDAATAKMVVEFKKWNNRFLHYVNGKPNGVGSMAETSDVGPRAKDVLNAWVEASKKR